MKKFLILIVIMSSNLYGQEKKIKFEFDTSYHQFYLSDKESPKATDSDDFWTDQALLDRLAIGNQLIGISTASYGPVEGEIEVFKTRPDERDFSKYDHVIEAGFSIGSGVLQILDSPNLNIEREINVQPGFYRIRVYSSGLSIEDEDEGGDYYTIEIWRSEETEKTILKMYR